MKHILPLILSLLCSASAMDSGLDKDPTKSQKDSISSLQSLESSNNLQNLWMQSIQKNDAKAQYELFCIYRDGLLGQEKNPKQAIVCGLKARNRPDPYPCIIEELPRYLWNLYVENLETNFKLAESYLIQGANLCPFDGLCLVEENMAYIGNYKKSELKKFKPTGYTLQNEEMITEKHSSVEAELTYQSEFCSEYLAAVNQYCDKLFGYIDNLSPQITQTALRINHLHKTDIMIDQILKDGSVLYIYYRKILSLCQNQKIAVDYCDQFKDAAFVKLARLGSKLGIEATQWPRSWSVQNKKLLIELLKDIENQILSFMQKNYYLPGFCDIANSLIEKKKYNSALGIYCQFLKHAPLTKDVCDGIYNLCSTMESSKLIIPNEPFLDIRVHLKHIIQSPPSFIKFDAYANYTHFVRAGLIELDPNETILSLTLERLELQNDAYTLTEIGDIYTNEKDPETAYRYYLLAAEKGELATPMIKIAKLLLGSLSFKSESPEKDALDWYKKAAATGNPFAQKLLARLEAMIQDKEMTQKTVNPNDWSVKYNIPKQKKQTSSKKSRKMQRLKQQQTTTLTNESANDDMAFQDILEIVDNFSETEIESLAKEMDMEVQENKENEPINPELALQEELKLYESEKYPAKVKHSKTMRDQLRKMAMIHQLQQVQPTQSQGFLVMDKVEYTVLCDIFDLKKPNISDKEFIQFATCDALKGIIKIFKTKSGYALVGKSGQMSEETAEDLTAGTHWNHTGKRDGLDWHFVAEIRHILECLGVTPQSVTVK